MKTSQVYGTSRKLELGVLKVEIAHTFNVSISYINKLYNLLIAHVHLSQSTWPLNVLAIQMCQYSLGLALMISNK